MVRNHFKTIAEKGGLAVHLASLGVDYAYFCEIDDSGVTITAMQKLLKRKYPERKSPFAWTTVKGWREYRKEQS